MPGSKGLIKFALYEAFVIEKVRYDAHNPGSVRACGCVTQAVCVVRLQVILRSSPRDQIYVPQLFIT